MKKDEFENHFLNCIFYLSLYSKQIRSFRTFNFLATTFFRSSTVSLLLTVTENGPPVNGATVTIILSPDNVWTDGVVVGTLLRDVDGDGPPTLAWFVFTGLEDPDSSKSDGFSAGLEFVSSDPWSVVGFISTSALEDWEEVWLCLSVMLLLLEQEQITVLWMLKNGLSEVSFDGEKLNSIFLRFSFDHDSIW